MKENDPIEIRTVGNGFIVAPRIGPMVAILDSETKVFRSMNELCRFIEGHFSHRGQGLESDS